MTIIRKATSNDVTQLRILARAMYDESKYTAVTYDEQRVATLLRTLVNDSDAAVLAAETPDGQLVGALLLQVMDYWFSKEKFVSDIAFFVLPNWRMSRVAMKLTAAGEAWARTRGGALVIGITALDNTEVAASMFNKIGYSPWGHVVRKEL